ncbi:CoA transferase [Pseudomonas anguilliseptica]|uniref:Crotonobetainyl-CoA:carnitine CoA-transferase CaiB n=1 Tax=Pseudomonas anguilliseptica TaxID=53406 RepID=A0A1H5FFP8_PSEAG|nr:CoA transferase [Pseudomonas anguilliseptica]SEE01848.1 Crotonobetainyl-CoA:carnitine CoA-transferase CaiB [Pseudomonas anguilliseptica]
MSRLLHGCSFSGSFASTSPGFSALAASLRYQATTLGLNPQVSSDDPTDGGLSFSLRHPDFKPLHAVIHGWHDGSSAGLTEHTVQAACGLMSVHGRASGKAQALGLDYVSTLSASLALQGSFAAALGQLRGGDFSRVETSMAAAGVLGIAQYLAGATAGGEAERLLPGATCTKNRPPFVSADGVHFELETLDAEPWRRFWASVGIDGEQAGQGWKAFLLRYAKAVAPMPGVFRQTLARLSMARITALCALSGMALCPLRSLAERRADSDLPGQLEQGPWCFDTSIGGTKTLPMLSCSALPLSGLRVIESCRRIQGPLAGHLLALLGAEVIRIELPGGDPLRGMPPCVDGVSVRFDALNRHKQVRELDIKSAAGREELYERARDADVFLHNWAPGKAAELGLDRVDLARVNPSLVYAYAGGWGHDRSGETLPGTDFVVQAWSGVGEQIGQASATPGGSLFTVLDVLGGVVAAQGVSAALLHRALSGQGVRVDSSLLGAANLLCVRQLQGADSADSSLFKGVYPTRSGLLAIDCQTPAQLQQLEVILACDLHGDPEGRDELICSALASKPAATWQQLLGDAVIPATVAVEDLSQLAQDGRLKTCLSVNAYTSVNAHWSFR